MNRVMTLAIGQGRDPEDALEMANKTAVIIKAAVNGNISDRHSAMTQALTGDDYPQANQIFTRAGAKGLGKAALQLPLGKTKVRSNLGNTQALGIVGADIFHHLKYRALGMVEHALVALDNATEPIHLSRTIKQR